MITWDSFFDRVVKLQMEFRLAKEAISGWAHSQEALDHYAKSQLEELREMFKQAEKKDAWVFSDQKRIDEYLQFHRKDAPQRTEQVLERLSQHEFVLHVTILEDLLKSIHRDVLRAHPNLLREDRQISLGQLVSQDKEAILSMEVEREVQSLDRKNVKEKYEYFRNRLKINWFDGKIVPLFEEVIRLRNIVLHEKPDQKISEENMLILSMVSTGLAFSTIIGAGILYPEACTPPKELSAEQAKLFVVRP